MSIRLDPRRLAALKLLAAEAGVRPGELVTQWVEERLDAARTGKPAAAKPGTDALAAINARIDELTARLDSLASTPPPQAAEAPPAAETPPAEAAPKRRGRPRKDGVAAPAPATAPRVPLHEEIIAVLAARGPMSAAELATTIRERGRYAPPRSAKELDAAAVNARVSNPTYRARFARAEGKIGLADQPA